MKKNSLGTLFSAVTFLALSAALYLVFLYAPVEKTMGVVQKIFYFHVSSAWIAFLAFFVVFLGSLGYLLTGRRRWDRLAASSAEIGVTFCTIVLVTGPIWAKPVWGIWWTWDARLTFTLVLWLIYVSYLMLRRYVAEPDKKATFTAVLGVIGFIDVPLVYMSIRWWRTQHPKPVIAGGPKSGLAEPMLHAFLVSLAAFTLFYFYLLEKRLSLEKAREAVDELEAKVEARERRKE